MTSPPFTQEQMEAAICAAFASPIRIRILKALNKGPLDVGQLASELQLSRTAVSQHLSILRTQELVRLVQRGVSLHQYHLADQRAIQILDIVNAILHDQVTNRANLVNREGSS